jgi:hypothetical protein
MSQHAHDEPSKAKHSPAPHHEPPAPAADAPVAEAMGSQQAHDHFLPLARAIAAADIIPLRADVHVAYHNAKTGTDAVLAHADRIVRELPAVKLAELREIPQLAQGVIFAALLVEGSAPESSIAADLATASPLRQVLLVAAEALAASDYLPRARVKAIRAGRGKLDVANDCVALAALLREHAAAIAGKTAVTPEQIDQADVVGSRLQTRLKTRGVPRGQVAPPEVQARTEARDRLWTLLHHRWDTLWRAGAYLLGRDVDEHVPSLYAREHAPRRQETPAPKPPQGNATGG